MRNIIILGAFAAAVVVWSTKADKVLVDVGRLGVDAHRIEVVSVQQAGDADFIFARTLSAGQRIEIKAVNGDISAVRSEDGQLRVQADKEFRRSNPDLVRIEAVEYDEGITICAVYPSRSSRSNYCAPGERGRMNVNNNDVQVNFTVFVPEGVSFIGNTTNGDVDALELTSDAFVRTVNGDIQIVTTGSAAAHTVNGDISARFAQLAKAARFETVNGDIELGLVDGIAASIRGSSVNGEISSALPLQIRAGNGPQSVRGELGSGGAELIVSSVNGDISFDRNR